MSEALPPHCDHTSVGVIIENEQGEIALVQRARFAAGIAPPAGHIDDHGFPEQAAVDEVSEELGLTLAIEGLSRTVIQRRHVNNPCRRMGGDHHNWWIYKAANFEGNLLPNADETKGAGWYDNEQLQHLADR